MKSKKILIIGAGPGGLTTGMILAHKGYEVTILEKEKQVGGRNASIKLGDYTHDIGPTFLLMRQFLDDMFTRAGRKTENYLKLTKLDPMYRLYLPGVTLEVSSNHEKMRAEIAKKFPGEEKGFDRFLKDEKRRYELMEPCLAVPYQKASSMLSKNLRRALPALAIGKTVSNILPRYANDDRLKLMYSFQTKYLGMSPWNCPAAFMILPYLEHAYGIYHVEGGLSEISEAMAKVIKEDGGSIRTESTVKKMLLKGKKVIGAQLESGEEILADTVIVNADFAHAMSHLVEPGVLRKYSREKLAKKKYSCSTFMMYLNVDKVYDNIEHHNIIFAKDYKKNLDDIFIRKIIPKGEISYYIRNSSINDATAAPDGKSQLYILVPVPNQESGINWDQAKEAFRERVLKEVESKLELKNLKSNIIDERVVTPQTWEQKYNVYNGATFNLAHTLGQMLYFRPHNKFDELENCYIVGGGTHPGSGLPTIYESGRIASDLIMNDPT